MGWNQTEFASRPRMLLAYTDAAYASESCRYFRRMGWEVQLVASGCEARTLAHETRPDVLVLETGLLDESGWLTSAKISLETPDMQIVLVGDWQSGDAGNRLRMAGADRSVWREDGAQGLADAILPTRTYSEAV